MWIFPWKVDSSPRRREGSPRQMGPPRLGHACLGKPEGSEDGLFGPPRQGVAFLGKPLCLGKAMLHLGELAAVQGLCLGPIWSRSHGLVFYCCGMLRGPLCDLFEYVIA